MSELSMVAKVDENGVLVVPKEAVEKLNLKAGDTVSVVERSGHIILEKHVDHCVLCGSTENLVPPLYCVCETCMAGIRDGHVKTTGMDF